MGCCISSDNKNTHSPNALSKPPLVPPCLNSRAPPPCLEEETVKEVVLSETRLTKPLTPKGNNTAHMSVIQEHSVEAKNLINKYEEETSQVTQVSEIYSISESFSTTTTPTTVALAERKEDEAVNKTTRESNHRSPAKVPRTRPNAGDILRGAKSPSKRVETSWVMSRTVPGKTMPRNVRSTSGVRSENGECSSVRQSRSSVTRTTGGVARRSPGKVTGRPGGRLRVENAGKEEINDSVLREKSEFNESRYNPHVSLECFIFL